MEPREPHKTCPTCANATKKMHTEPCRTCIDEGDSKRAPHFSKWQAKP
jgi:predicted amidophosphoribosyltransferase